MPKLIIAVTDSQSLVLLRGQLSAAREYGFDVSVISSPGELATTITSAEGVRLIEVAMKRGMDPVADLRSLFELVGVLRRERPDVINAGTPKAGLLVGLAGLLVRTPVRIHTLRGLRFETMAGAAGSLMKWLTRLTCQVSHLVICISPSLRQAAIDHGVVDAERAVVLGAGSSNGVDLERFTPSPELRGRAAELRRVHGIPAAAVTLGFVGRLATDKGVVELHQAWMRLRERHPELHLVVVGSLDPSDPPPPEIEPWLRSDERVHWLGQLQDMPPAYLSMDVLTLPTYREGMGNVLLEAAAMSIPTVATRVTGCVDAVADGETGALVPVRDEAALADALDRYVADPELRQRHGAAGRARVEELYRPALIWRLLHETYERLLVERGLGGVG